MDCDFLFQVDKRVREQTKQVIEIIARERDIIRERVDPVNDDHLQVGEYGQQVDSDPRMKEYAAKPEIFRDHIPQVTIAKAHLGIDHRV